jgi:hypothetical protein
MLAATLGAGDDEIPLAIIRAAPIQNQAPGTSPKIT